jgi:hypothetical protein
MHARNERPPAFCKRSRSGRQDYDFVINWNNITYNITRYGLEIYSMEKDEIKAAMSKDLNTNPMPCL